MAQNTAAEDAQNMTVATFDNKTTKETITVKGDIINREKRHNAEWCNEQVTVRTQEGDEFTFFMGDTLATRNVKKNGNTVGKWTAFLE